VRVRVRARAGVGVGVGIRVRVRVRVTVTVRVRVRLTAHKVLLGRAEREIDHGGARHAAGREQPVIRRVVFVRRRREHLERRVVGSLDLG